MANPFPGMNPFLERYWGDVHTRLTMYSCDELQPQLPKGLKARVEEQVRLDAEDDSGFRVPDVRVVERPLAPTGGTALADVDVSEPLVVEIGNDPVTERRILIVDHATQDRVVTAIEFVSPSNKVAESERKRFRQKQRAMLDAEVSIVEIDLVRQGEWVLTAPPDALPEAYRYPYAVCVVRGTCRWRFECYAAPLQEPLPTIRIPLREGDDDAVLRLQAVLDLAIERGAYDDIDYANHRPSGFTPQDVEWIDNRLREQGLVTPPGGEAK